MTAPRVATFHDDYQSVKPGPPYPSAGPPRDTSMGIRGWPPQCPSVHLLRIVGYHPTLQPLKLLSLQDPINPVCVSTLSILFTRARRSVLNRHRRGLPPSEL
jgi:hypothetical protein